MSPPALQANRLKDPLIRHWVSRAGKDRGWRRADLVMATEGRKEGLVEVREGGREERRVGGRKTVWPGPSAHSGALDSPQSTCICLWF